MNKHKKRNKEEHSHEPKVDVRDFSDQHLYPTEILTKVLHNYPNNAIIKQELMKRLKGTP